MADFASRLEEKEFNEIDAFLPCLWKIGLLTDIDCATIASTKTLSEKQSAIYRVIMSKSKEHASDLTERFRTLNLAIHTEENSTSINSQDSEVEKDKLEPPIPCLGNPLLHNTVIKCIFGYLPLSDIKSCRLVCHPWNSVAEIFLRKRSIIHFRPIVLPPADFLRVSQLALPDLPFRSFIFSNDRNSPCSTRELDKFFLSCGKNIQEIKLKCVNLKDEQDPETILPSYDVSNWIANMPNISNLKIRRVYSEDEEQKSTLLEISSNTLTTIKNIYMEECGMKISRMAPLNIYMNNVGFERDGDDLQTFRFNDFVDFSQALNICLAGKELYAGDAIFDMGLHKFNLDQLHLHNVNVENWSQAEGNVQFLHLKDIPFTEKNNLNIKYLKFRDHEIDLSVLPQTIEKMWLCEYTDMSCTQPLDMPNLSFLSFELVNGYSVFLSHFETCANLIELEIGRDTLSAGEPGPWNFQISWVPQNVRRMKITTLELEFVIDCILILNLDTLILMDYEGSSPFTDFEKLTTHIKADVLVVVCNEKMEIDTSDIIKLMLANQQSQKVLIGSHSDLHKNTPFEGSPFSSYVDCKFNYYQFEHQIGKAITREEFETFIHLDNEEIPTPFFEDKIMGFTSY